MTRSPGSSAPTVHRLAFSRPHHRYLVRTALDLAALVLTEPEVPWARRARHAGGQRPQDRFPALRRRRAASRPARCSRSLSRCASRPSVGASPCSSGRRTTPSTPGVRSTRCCSTTRTERHRLTATSGTPTPRSSGSSSRRPSSTAWRVAPGELALELWRAVDGFLAAVPAPQSAAAPASARRAMTAAAAVPVFDLTGPLPTGRTVIEASAGTGKTYSISGLVVRYLAEEAVSIDQLLVVTFTAGRGERAARPHPVVAAAGGRSPRRGPAAARRRVDVRPHPSRRARRGPTRRAAGAPASRREPLRRSDDHHHPRLRAAGPRPVRRPLRCRAGSRRWSSTTASWWSRCAATTSSGIWSTTPGDVARRTANGDRRCAPDAVETRPRRRGQRSLTNAGAASEPPPGLAGLAGEWAASSTRPRPRSSGDGGRVTRCRTTSSIGDLHRALTDVVGRIGARRPARRALPARAGRRVPGHRPTAVGGVRPGLRGRASDHRRRPEAGHLPVPRRRRASLPRGGARQPRPSAWPPTSAPTDACCAPSAPSSTAPRSATRRCASPPSSPHPTPSSRRSTTVRRRLCTSGWFPTTGHCPRPRRAR